MLKDQFNYNTLKVSLKRLVEKGKLMRYAKGVYYYSAPDSSGSVNIKDVVSALYLYKGGKTIGYLSGQSFAKELKLSLDVAELTVVTNEEASRKRRITIASHSLVLRAPRVLINDDNVKVLQLLDLMTDCEDLCTADGATFQNAIDHYLDDNDIIIQDIFPYLKHYPAKTSQNLLHFFLKPSEKSGCSKLL